MVTREVMRIGEDKATFSESISNVVSAEILTLLLIARDVALKIVPCNILLSQQCCVKSCLVKHGFKIAVKNCR